MYDIIALQSKVFTFFSEFAVHLIKFLFYCNFHCDTDISSKHKNLYIASFGYLYGFDTKFM